MAPFKNVYFAIKKIFYWCFVAILGKTTTHLRKKHNRNYKSDLLVEEAKLLKANPQYAYVRLEDGREIPVSL